MGQILVMEDEPNIREVLSILLELEGHSVLTAPDGAAGLRMIAECVPDVVLLDVMMPCLDGFAVAEELRGHPRTAGVPIVFLTARTRAEVIRAGWREDRDGFVTKPFDNNALVGEIVRVLAAARARPGTDHLVATDQVGER